MSILLLGGSPQLPSSSSRLLLHIGEQLALQGHSYAQLHVRDLPARALLLADYDDAAIARAVRAVADADAIVIATPIYKASYTGLLKAFLDLLPQDGLAGKLVLPLATGGGHAHTLALDYALRPVLHALGAKQVFTSIYANAQQLAWHEEGGLSLDAPIAARVQAGIEELSTGLFVLQGRRPPAPVDISLPVRSLQDQPYAPQYQAA
ncbi:FMN reductase (NADPH) [Janthinobacterium agaricidamnosum]|uniref:FMN reductase (NADPH) n=1 Tax=Janthinobacterium agaricidamnosum TaxID=55508 RepID=A0A3G2E6Y8_9BURK|nr:MULTISPECIES: NADPH-dependent FMN reductase [Janthinobacterium]AYM75913.1 FMN reductase (NADPH) [Janthinobacterium agaricidamnosum]OFA01025.1 FMN reductase (NADPH) [Janthinobacterium sp. HH107]